MFYDLIPHLINGVALGLLFALLALGFMLIIGVIVGAVAVMALPAAQRELVKWVALGVSLAVLAVTVVVAVGFDPAGAQFQFVESHRFGFDKCQIQLACLFQGVHQTECQSGIGAGVRP